MITSGKRHRTDDGTVDSLVCASVVVDVWSEAAQHVNQMYAVQVT